METWTFTFADMSSFPILREDGLRNVLLRNDGGFTFTNVTEQSGIDVHMRLSFQSLWWDFNQDGHQDVLVINDKDGANSMFENLGDGTFIDVAPNIGADIVMDAMTLSLGDFNGKMVGKICTTPTRGLAETVWAPNSVFSKKTDTFPKESANHNIALDEFCWGRWRGWMSTTTQTSICL